MEKGTSPEVRTMLREFCKIQREKYGPDWKRILAKEMTEKTAPYVDAILKLSKRNAAI
jgi:hypothetical protein